MKLKDLTDWKWWNTELKFFDKKPKLNLTDYLYSGAKPEYISGAFNCSGLYGPQEKFKSDIEIID